MDWTFQTTHYKTIAMQYVKVKLKQQIQVTLKSRMPSQKDIRLYNLQQNGNRKEVVT
jgi:hypothetical protein